MWTAWICLGSGLRWIGRRITRLILGLTVIAVHCTLGIMIRGIRRTLWSRFVAACLFGLASLVATPSAMATTATPDEIFDWAQGAYPQYFPGPASTVYTPGAVYRHYPQTGNYVGVLGEQVAILGPVSGNQLQVVGTVGTFACLAIPVRCAPTPAFDGAWGVPSMSCLKTRPVSGQYWNPTTGAVGDQYMELVNGCTVTVVATYCTSWCYGPFEVVLRNGQIVLGYSHSSNNMGVGQYPPGWVIATYTGSNISVMACVYDQRAYDLGIRPVMMSPSQGGGVCR
jgi:hypothetical protein